MDYHHFQKATTYTNVVVVVIDVIAVVTTMSDTVVNIMIQPVVSHSICQSDPSKHVALYRWGLPPNYTPQFSNGNAFVPYQTFVVPPANGNSVAYPWSITHHSPQVVDVDNHEIPQGLTHHTSMLVITETSNDNKVEYIRPHLYFHVPPQATQPTIHNLN